jgi:hypothetical protein
LTEPKIVGPSPNGCRSHPQFARYELLAVVSCREPRSVPSPTVPQCFFEKHLRGMRASRGAGRLQLSIDRAAAPRFTLQTRTNNV